ncbi:hypothetical protein [Streptomyces sp. NPDC057413]|uniref:hypothetical protein n=1 Tax=Streptomyces sp. NPDC057413 TaxID=3346124 RepID=UPI00367F5CEF
MRGVDCGLIAEGHRCLRCNGGSYQMWRTVQPAARSAIMLQSVGTGRCLNPQDNGYYRTAPCDRSAQNQPFTVG